jgi:hypothetical protein
VRNPGAANSRETRPPAFEKGRPLRLHARHVALIVAAFGTAFASGTPGIASMLPSVSCENPTSRLASVVSIIERESLFFIDPKVFVN